MIKAVIFDVDGVLVDSLEPHLQITRDLAQEFGVLAQVPTAEEFKDLVRIRPVSPMKAFFEACGYSADLAARADERYRVEFTKNYVPLLFPHVPDLLTTLKAAGVPMGIATLNVMRNIIPSLGNHMDVFHPDCLFEGGDARAATKAEALTCGARALGLSPEEVLLVGDQFSDWNAARKAGTQFLGVTYGWGICASDTDFPTVDSVHDIVKHVLARQ
jgi:phosphoglycolate phosphatase